MTKCTTFPPLQLALNTLYHSKRKNTSKNANTPRTTLPFFETTPTPSPPLLNPTNRLTPTLQANNCNLRPHQQPWNRRMHDSLPRRRSSHQQHQQQQRRLSRPRGMGNRQRRIIRLPRLLHLQRAVPQRSSQHSVRRRNSIIYYFRYGHGWCADDPRV